ncbi:MAG: integrase [Desulfuromonas sp.]|nr:MAG: integrase [Desulfuromonas sp.]
MVEDRLLRLREVLETAQLDAIFLASSVQLYYFCGFNGSDGGLLVFRDHVIFLTDSRYTTQARSEVSANEIVEYRSKQEGVTEALRRCKARRIGFEAEQLSVAALERLRRSGDDAFEWVALEKELVALRGVKSPEEISLLDQAAHLNEMAFNEILPLLRPGTPEKEVAMALEFALRRHGGEEKSFDFIVASGERGALPHGVASEKRLAAGELVTIDFGTRFCGYCSDETVTVAIGPVSQRLRELFELVLAAHDRAMARVRPGVSLLEIDRAARSWISRHGLGGSFGHGLGHGVGLEVHEYPTVSPRSESVACEGMVFTIEPGVYLPSVGGVRIEDTVVVTATGCRSLTRISKRFRSLPL